MSIKEICLDDADISSPILVDETTGGEEPSEQEDPKVSSEDIERWEGEGGSIPS